MQVLSLRTGTWQQFSFSCPSLCIVLGLFTQSSSLGTWLGVCRVYALKVVHPVSEALKRRRRHSVKSSWLPALQVACVERLGHSRSRSCILTFPPPHITPCGLPAAACCWAEALRLASLAACLHTVRQEP